MKVFRILVINPGSTSTKIAVYDSNEVIFLKNINHSKDELKQFNRISEQYDFRKNIIINEIENAGISIKTLKAVVGRGGLVKPIESGVYKVNDALIRDLKNSPLGEHASNLGGLIASDIASKIENAIALIADPVVVDELSPLARISGHPAFLRRSIFHALNQKAVARDYSKSIMRKYEDLNLIVVHLGGGITVGAHEKGRVVDVNQGLDGEGPFSPERSGTLPVGDLVKTSFSGQYSQKKLQSMIVGEGGLVAYLGTNSAYEVEKMVENGDQYARLIYEAMAYQIAKTVGSMYPVLRGNVDAILITGGIAHSKYFVNLIIERVHKLAPVHIYPGGDEMKALATNALMVLTGEVEAKTYDK